VFLSGNEGKGRSFSACLQMQAGGGKITHRELYRSTELQANMYNTVAIYQDAVFGFGGGAKAGFLHCTNLDDGRLLWKEESRDWTKDQNLTRLCGFAARLRPTSFSCCRFPCEASGEAAEPR
jgi:hypothetical protein